MDSNKGDTTNFHLFDSAGVGLAGLDENGLILQTNESFLRYLELDIGKILGKEISVINMSITSPEFWEAFPSQVPFYCLMPGRNHLLLTICRDYSGPSEEVIKKIVLLRPYSLEREFIRMRSLLNHNVVLDISSHLSSIAIASEIILQPELQEDENTRRRFLSAFFQDITDLNQLFAELQEIAEPMPFPNRVRHSALDWKGLVSDLAVKMRGLASEKNVHLSCDLPSGTASVQGDYHWLYLALYGVINYAIGEAPPLSDVCLICRRLGDSLETSIEFSSNQEKGEHPWPPQTLFHLHGDDPRIGKMNFSELALSRSILMLNRGDLEQRKEGATTRLISRMPA